MPTLPCILAILGSSAIFLLSLFSKKKGNTRHWPFVGILPTVFLNYNRLHDKVAELLEENNGSILLKCSLFLNRDILVTGNPADVRYIMSTQFSNYPKGPEWSKRFDIFGSGSFNTDFDEWMGHRKAIRLLFSHQKFKRLMGSILQECIIKELIPILDLVSAQELAVDFRVLIKYFVSYFSFYISAGRKPKPVDIYHLEDDPLTEAFDDAGEAILVRHLLPVTFWKLMKNLRLGKEKKYSKAWETLDAIFAQYASIAQEEISRGCHKDSTRDVDVDDFNPLKLYMIGHEITGPEPKPYNIIRDNILGLIFAAGDTTSTALSWFFLLLSKHPNVEAKIRQELKQVSPIRKCEIKKFLVLNSKELDKMVYLEAAINETLRLYPPVPYEARTPIHPDTLPSGYQVSKKTTIMISVYSMGRMKSLWGEDCHEFKPERWITEDGKIRHEPSHRFFAFSSGPRICPGKDYAYVLLKTFIATIMQNFHVQVVVKHPVTPKTSIILQQNEGLMVRIKKIA